MRITRRMLVASAVPALMRGAERTMDGGSGPQFLAAALTTLDSRRRFDEAMAKDYLSYLAAGASMACWCLEPPVSLRRSP
jgi:hypothetical protein